ncbi:collagen alpha-1(II) chain-like isoform X2 [Haemorhous mexicanus]|uniref:collagen alpha-1(II) chain-like isoform X2 n=1 Tax=Haemorhous mexicanus TaxID=30427 RepID=UPI0028BEB133|nr:collagen alpha-1(II) chain-like isoform X2 [Haemorhous mexicanus]
MVWPLVLALLAVPAVPSPAGCRRARGAPCARARPAPALAALGRGFDVTTMEMAAGRVLELGDTWGHTWGDTWGGGDSGDSGDSGDNDGPGGPGGTWSGPGGPGGDNGGPGGTWDTWQDGDSGDSGDSGGPGGTWDTWQDGDSGDNDGPGGDNGDNGGTWDTWGDGNHGGPGGIRGHHGGPGGDSGDNADPKAVPKAVPGVPGGPGGDKAVPKGVPRVPKGVPRGVPGGPGGPGGDRAVPKGVPRCVLCPDALRPGSPRRVPAHLGGWSSGRRCHRQSRVAVGAGAVGAAVTSSVTRGWSFGLGWGRGQAGVVGAGSQSRVAQEGLRWQRQDRSALTWQEITCVFYWTWLDPTSARPSPSFLRAVRALPPRFSPATAAAYAELLSAWGTHAVRSARLGGRLRSLSALRLCRAAMAGLGAATGTGDGDRDPRVTRDSDQGPQSERGQSDQGPQSERGQ